jgi:DNA modification methylase
VGDRLIHGQVQTGLFQLEDESVDLVFTSPPWWPSRPYEGEPTVWHGNKATLLGCEDSVHTYVDRLAGVLGQCQRLLKPDGLLWVVMSDHQTETQRIPVCSLLVQRMCYFHASYRWKLAHELHWNKSWDPNPLIPGGTLLVFAKKNPIPRTWVKAMYAFPEVEVPGYHWSTYAPAMVTEAIRDSFPFPLARESGVLLDPFCGSGASLIGAKRAGWNFIGIDMDPRGINLSAKTLGVMPDVV